MEEDEMRKKLAPTQMSENEKKLNRKDMVAFSNGIPATNPKIVGLRSSSIGPEKKYIAQNYGLKPAEYLQVPQLSKNPGSPLGVGAYLTLEDPRAASMLKRSSPSGSSGEEK